MKKYFFTWIFGIFLLCGCSKTNEIQENITESNNGYFFPLDTTSCTYEGTTFWEQCTFEETTQPKEIVLSITKVQSFETGDLYELKINCDKNAEDRFDMDRSHLGFFFVQKDKIYRIDNETIKGKSPTAEEIINAGTLVCNETGTEDALDENESGWHEYILANGNRREYHGYNTLVETGYYECFIWESGKGLVEYRSGYGAEADAINFSLSNNPPI